LLRLVGDGCADGIPNTYPARVADGGGTACRRKRDEACRRTLDRDRVRRTVGSG
jgi:hypothetical protein